MWAQHWAHIYRNVQIYFLQKNLKDLNYVIIEVCFVLHMAYALMCHFIT